jgi:hypothetical protein
MQIAISQIHEYIECAVIVQEDFLTHHFWGAKVIKPFGTFQVGDCPKHLIHHAGRNTFEHKY